MQDHQIAEAIWGKEAELALDRSPNTCLQLGGGWFLGQGSLVVKRYSNLLPFL